MHIYHHLEEFKAKKPIVTIGTFDGVHRGHHRVISQLKEIANREHGESVIFTFDPHPRLVIAPDKENLRLLTTLDEKTELFASMGIDHLIVFPFTKEFSRLTYTEFIQKILVNKIGIHRLVVGYDHRFGKNREGTYEILQEMAHKFNFGIDQLDVLSIDSTHISSTQIRNALQKGDITTANRFLGYSFQLHGQVVQGNQIGRKLKFPTANIVASDHYKIVPAEGVYAVRADVEGKIYDGMLNIGTRPTVNINADHRSIEAHLFDFDNDIYGKYLTLFFEQRIRAEKKFSGLEALQKQLEQDKQTALSILRKKK